MSYQQYQSKNTASTGQLQWNGSSWVPKTGQSADPQGHSEYSSDFATQRVANTATVAAEWNPVQLYTDYYHGWQAAIKTYQQSTLPDRQSRIQWAHYFSEMSSKAAHHYYQKPGVPPQFNLPPAPPLSDFSLRSSATSQQVTPQASAGAQNGTVSETSLSAYVRRCLAKCSSEAARKSVQVQVEQKIAAAIQKNILNTKDWSQEPLISEKGPSRCNHTLTPKHVASSQSSESTSYYGPQTTTFDTTRKQLTREDKSSEKVSTYSYYGPTDVVRLPTKPTTKSGKRPLDKQNGMDTSDTALRKRQNRFGNTQLSADNSSTLPKEDYRAYMGMAVIGSSSQMPITEEDYEKMTVKGTCLTLERDYLRLTSPPIPERVRPAFILQQHLRNLQKAYNTTNLQSRRDYLWFCSQLKAIRQDLTIQRIKGEVAVEAYETHARIALEQGDLNEFNQCQTQLIDLHELQQSENEDEFCAYRLLYHLYLMTTQEDQTAAAAVAILGYLKEKKKGAASKHALLVRDALVHNDCGKLIKLHHNAPHLGKFLTQRLLPTMRWRTLQVICKAYRPNIEIKFVNRMLGFETSQCVQWLTRCGANVDNLNSRLLTKESEGTISEALALTNPTSL